MRGRMMAFRDRREAGRRLGRQLARWKGHDVVVAALPRGGVPVGYEVAAILQCPLDVLMVRKLGHPHQPELGIGAIGEDGVRVLNRELVDASGVSAADIERVQRRESAELDRRTVRYRRELPPVPVDGRTVILVDDGVATGSTARAGVEVLRRRGARWIIVAVPVAGPDAVASLRKVADDVVCDSTPHRLRSIGEWYADFAQVSDDEVALLLAASRRTVPAREPVSGSPVPIGPPEPTRPADDPTSRTDPHPVRRSLHLELDDGTRLPAEIVIPGCPLGIVVFAHGSGSSRHSPRNLEVAATLQEHGFATWLFDLLTTREARDRANIFDIPLLAGRVAAAVRAVEQSGELAGLPVGLFGASTGAAAALVAAANLGDGIRAVVARGGRPDLAAQSLSAVTAPTLLLVGERDLDVMELNHQAERQLTCTHRLVAIPGATHLFEEPGAMDAVASAAVGWFREHLPE